MEQIINFLKDYYIVINIALIALIFILIIVVICSLINISKLKSKYRKVTRGTNNKNLEELLISSLEKIDKIEQKANDAISTSEDTLKLTEKCVQKVSIQRYKAFEDVGSDLSYSIALLDGNNNGVIISSIYSRHESITYAKPIDNGISRYDLSDEEENVLFQAMNTNIKEKS